MRDLFVRFRGSNSFLGVMIAFVAVWLVSRRVFYFDQDFGMLNLILSAEASIATCMLLDFSLKGMEADRATFAKLLEVADQTKQAVSDMSEDLEEVLQGECEDDECQT
jgi:uncharacterized membrane protein